jgi:hypothetical protein
MQNFQLLQISLQIFLPITSVSGRSWRTVFLSFPPSFPLGGNTTLEAHMWSLHCFLTFDSIRITKETKVWWGFVVCLGFSSLSSCVSIGIRQAPERQIWVMVLGSIQNCLQWQSLLVVLIPRLADSLGIRYILSGYNLCHSLAMRLSRLTSQSLLFLHL